MLFRNWQTVKAQYIQWANLWFILGQHVNFSNLKLSLSSFKDIPDVTKPPTDYTFDWNPCTKFSEGDGCKNMLVSALKAQCKRERFYRDILVPKGHNPFG